MQSISTITSIKKYTHLQDKFIQYLDSLSVNHKKAKIAEKANIGTCYNTLANN